jgi:nicotinamidase-related amidase
MTDPHFPITPAPGAGDVLVVVDVQHDFLPGGALGVSDGDRIIPPLNRVIDRFLQAGLPIFFSRDWHPPDHCSFREQGGPWPPHCIRGTWGAAFAENLHVPDGAVIISKGTQKDEEQYSTLFGHDAEGRTLARRLEDLPVRRVFIGGLATDYCVLNTVRDAAKMGFRLWVMTDAVAAVDIQPGDGARALDEMVRNGAVLITSGEPAS